MLRSVLLGAFALIFSVPVASALTVVERYSVMSYNMNQHSLFMNNNKYHFLSGAVFERYDDGTGKLTGTATKNANPGAEGFKVSLDFGNLNNTYTDFRTWSEQQALGSGAKTGGGNNVQDWTYMDLLPSSTLMGLNGISATYNLIMKPLAYGSATFQYGIGANDKQANVLGLSGWFYTAGTNANGTGYPCKKNANNNGGSTCDFNLKLTPIPVPVPAGIALLPVGLAVLAGMRMRRRKAA
ncbi:MAG: VPLPA-CTERM sorting domain-containing protein [Roseibium sp.]|uniref:VPLPA-CTERM sorting domain-containing protein n=1 Tax=Roseibium sp. TaxID=1936156 RepID=UPI003D9C3036